jgi:integrase
MSTQVGQYRDWSALIGRADLAESTKDKYKRALQRYLATGNGLTDADALLLYVESLSASGRAFLKAALRLITNEMATSLKGKATPENLGKVQAALLRIEALQDTIKAPAPKGVKPHLWLNSHEVEELLGTCDSNLAGQRDRLALALLVAAGLRREEAVSLCFEDVQVQPVQGHMRAVLSIKGKGAKNRVVPISDDLANLVDAWGDTIGRGGPVLRSVNKGGKVGNSLSAQGLFTIVQRHGALIGLPELAPHDLRRTYAQIGYESGVPVTQISRLLGHESIETTQRYLDLTLDLETTISDFVPIGP